MSNLNGALNCSSSVVGEKAGTKLNFKPCILLIFLSKHPFTVLNICNLFTSKKNFKCQNVKPISRSELSNLKHIIESLFPQLKIKFSFQKIWFENMLAKQKELNNLS